MGFKAPSTIYKLKFDGQYEGLEVSVKSIPTGELMKLMKLAISLDSKAKDINPEDLDAVAKLFTGFAKALVSWNLTDDDDAAIPPTIDGVNDQEFGFVMTVIMVWIEAIAGVNADLGKGLSSGRTSPEVHIPMEPL